MGLRLWERMAGGRKELQLGVGQRRMMGASSHSLTSCQCHDFAIIDFANIDHYYHKEINENF